MPFIGIGLHILVALFFAVHVVRSGQNMYWLIILFSFPLLGSIVYFFAVYLPDSRLERGARKAVASAARALDPTRELRESRAAFDYTPTADNRLRLARALLDAGQSAEAVELFEACLSGPFSDDLGIRLEAAKASFEDRQYDKVIAHVAEIRKHDGNFRAEVVAVLHARALDAAGRSADAKAEFESAADRFGGFETQAEYLIWAILRQDLETAGRLQAEIQRRTERWNQHTKELNRPLLRRIEAAYELARKSA